MFINWNVFVGHVVSGNLDVGVISFRINTWNYESFLLIFLIQLKMYSAKQVFNLSFLKM